MESPRYNHSVPVVPSATVNFPLVSGRQLCDAIYVGGPGIVEAVLENNQTAAFTCVAGQVLPVAAKRVNAASTATLMAALYQV